MSLVAPVEQVHHADAAEAREVGAERPAQAGEVRGLDGRVDALPAAEARHHRRGDLDCVQMSSWQHVANFWGARFRLYQNEIDSALCDRSNEVRDRFCVV